MEPIVSPWFIYFLSVVNGILGICIGGLIASALVSYVGWLWIIIDGGDGVWERPSAVWGGVLAIVFLLAVLFIPSKQTIMTMYAASVATPDNISAALLAGKDLKDVVKADILEIIEAVQDAGEGE